MLATKHRSRNDDLLAVNGHGVRNHPANKTGQRWRKLRREALEAPDGGDHCGTTGRTGWISLTWQRHRGQAVQSWHDHKCGLAAVILGDTLVLSVRNRVDKFSFALRIMSLTQRLAF